MSRYNTNSIRVRRATEADAAILSELSGQLGYPSSAEEIRVRLASVEGRDEHAVLVAEVGGGVVGWVHVFEAQRIETDPFAEIGGFVIDSSQRGRGAGALLLKAAETWAFEHGFRAMRVRSNVVRLEAHGFYEKHGYRCRKRQTVFEKTLSAVTGDAPDARGV